MILESADKMHKIAAEYIESCDIDDELARNIKKCAEQGKFSYGFKGQLDDLTKQKLWQMQYTTHARWMGDSVYTKIFW